jgi:hypothetical protein
LRRFEIATDLGGDWGPKVIPENDPSNFGWTIRGKDGKLGEIWPTSFDTPDLVNLPGVSIREKHLLMYWILESAPNCPCEKATAGVILLQYLRLENGKPHHSSSNKVIAQW